MFRNNYNYNNNWLKIVSIPKNIKISPGPQNWLKIIPKLIKWHKYLWVFKLTRVSSQHLKLPIYSNTIATSANVNTWLYKSQGILGSRVPRNLPLHKYLLLFQSFYFLESTKENWQHKLPIRCHGLRRPGKSKFFFDTMIKGSQH